MGKNGKEIDSKGRGRKPPPLFLLVDAELIMTAKSHNYRDVRSWPQRSGHSGVLGKHGRSRFYYLLLFSKENVNR